MVSRKTKREGKNKYVSRRSASLGVSIASNALNPHCNELKYKPVETPTEAWLKRHILFSCLVFFSLRKGAAPLGGSDEAVEDLQVIIGSTRQSSDSCTNGCVGAAAGISFRPHVLVYSCLVILWFSPIDTYTRGRQIREQQNCMASIGER